MNGNVSLLDPWYLHVYACMHPGTWFIYDMYIEYIYGLAACM